MQKSGLNKKASPSAALSSDKLKAHSSKMEPVNASTPHCHKTDYSGWLMSASKAASVTWRSLLKMELRSALTT